MPEFLIPECNIIEKQILSVLEQFKKLKVEQVQYPELKSLLVYFLSEFEMRVWEQIKVTLKDNLYGYLHRQMFLDNKYDHIAYSSVSTLKIHFELFNKIKFKLKLKAPKYV